MDNYCFMLEALMKSQGLTQEVLAKKLGISATNISRWINGHVCPTVETVVKLCRCLKCTPNDLIKLD